MVSKGNGFRTYLDYDGVPLLKRMGNHYANMADPFNQGVLLEAVVRKCESIDQLMLPMEFIKETEHESS